MATPTELTSGLQRRELPSTALQLRAEADDSDAAEVEGIGVPYGQETELWPGVRESFAPGAVDLDLSADALLFYRHGEAIGRVIEQRNESDGWYPRANISDTTVGRDARTLARDGVLAGLSVGFQPIEHIERTDDDGTVHIEHTKVRVREVSLVPFPAYAGAAITNVRSDPQHTPTPERTPDVPETLTTEATEQLTELRGLVTELTRRVELGQHGHSDPTPAHPLLQFRSMGEFIKALATGSDQAREAYAAAMELRAYTGGSSADAQVPTNTWVGQQIEVAQAKQRVVNSFLHTYDLPAEGMGVDHGVLGSDTTSVEQQAAEGDDLAFGKITVGHASAGVGTFGGWSQLTLQEIQRMPINMLDLTWQALTARYGKRIERLGRSVFTAAHERAATGESTANRIALRKALADAGSSDWLAMVLDLAELFDDRDRELTAIKVSRDVFGAMADVPATSRMLVVNNTPPNQPGAGGTLDVTIPEANLYGLRIELVPNWSGANIAAYDRAAIRTQEAPGAPFRLQDSNVINLSQAFSVYGYAASYQQQADGIVAVTTAG